ncbi:RNA methyltransferase [Candidatus Saccharibacteria bacterium]|nr:RNA methyltransferase [Candidatus Saccharibacteria bacterium]
MPVNPYPISSRQNPKLKHINALRRSHYRKKTGEFLIEGFRELERAVASGRVEFGMVLISRECFLGKNEWQLLEKIPVEIFEVPKHMFEDLSYRDRPDGLMAVAKQFVFPTLTDATLRERPLLVIEGVEKPGNAGTIFRTAEGAGFTDIVIADPRVDLFNPNVVRASTGVMFNLNVMQQSIESVYEWLKQHGWTIVAITPEGKESVYDVDLTGKVALVFGSEQYGLSEYARAHYDIGASLPMLGAADSLNLAMCAGIIMYESNRQGTVK